MGNQDHWMIHVHQQLLINSSIWIYFLIQKSFLQMISEILFTAQRSSFWKFQAISIHIWRKRNMIKIQCEAKPSYFDWSWPRICLSTNFQSSFVYLNLQSTKYFGILWQLAMRILLLFQTFWKTGTALTK